MNVDLYQSLQMSEKYINNLLEVSKTASQVALGKLIELDKIEQKAYNFDSNLSRELKAEADTLVEREILNILTPLGVDILSEESGLLSMGSGSSLRFIVDPIDGTVNFVRGILNCSISIALYDANTPIFGVLASYPRKSLAWGGRRYGSYLDGKRLKVSTIKESEKGVLCTGFPSRFDFDNESMLSQVRLMSTFGKTRMLGSASQSLLSVAKGSVDCYSEKNIMLWDVAAGVAIVEGAGGRCVLESGDENYSLNVVADNNHLIR